MMAYIIKYGTYFKKKRFIAKSEIEIADGDSFQDIEGRVIIIVDSDDAINYVRIYFKKILLIS